MNGNHQKDIGPITMTTGRPTRSLIRCEDFGFGKSKADDFTRIYWKVRYIAGGILDRDVVQSRTKCREVEEHEHQLGLIHPLSCY